MRLFDVTEKTAVRKHGTTRKCRHCDTQLRDTIVHFGEKVGSVFVGELSSPLTKVAMGK